MRAPATAPSTSSAGVERGDWGCSRDGILEPIKVGIVGGGDPNKRASHSGI